MHSNGSMIDAKTVKKMIATQHVANTVLGEVDINDVDE